MAREHFEIVNSVPLDPPSAVWSPDEWNQMQRGHESSDMDDKWDIVVHGQRLDFHRSWTGQCIYRAWFSFNSVNWAIVRAEVCGDSATYRRTSDVADRLLLEALIRQELLDQDARELWNKWSEAVRQEQPPSPSG
jgi:hypothetical protein